MKYLGNYIACFLLQSWDFFLFFGKERKASKIKGKLGDLLKILFFAINFIIIQFRQ